MFRFAAPGVVLALLAFTATAGRCEPGAPPSGPDASGLEMAVVPAIDPSPMLLDGHWPEEPGRVIRWRGCRGEFEPASVVLRARRGLLDGLRFVLTDLAGPSGNLPATAFDLRFVLPWYQGSSAWSSHIQKPGAPRRVPELLVKDPMLIRIDGEPGDNLIRVGGPGSTRYVTARSQALEWGRATPSARTFPVRDATDLQPLDLRPEAPQQLWLTVAIPRDQPTGIYRGELRVIRSGALLATLPAELEVLPFDLKPTGMVHSVYYRGKLGSEAPTVSSEWKSPAQMEAELVDMARHGITNPTIYQPWPRPADSPSAAAARIALLEEVLELRNAAGFRGRDLLYLGRLTGDSSEDRVLARLASDVERIQTIAQRHGAGRVFLYGTDEAKGQALTRQIPAWTTVRARGAGVLAAGYVGHGEIMGGLTDILVLHTKLDRGEAAHQHRHGHRILSYHRPQAGPENPLPFRRNYGLALWQAGFDGAMLYAYQDSQGSIWNDLDHRKWRDTTLTYPTVLAPIPTLAWEGLREGIDDLRYLRTLEGRLRKGGPRSAEIRLYLDELRADRDFDADRARDRMIALLRKVS